MPLITKTDPLLLLSMDCSLKDMEEIYYLISPEMWKDETFYLINHAESNERGSNYRMEAGFDYEHRHCMSTVSPQPGDRMHGQFAIYTKKAMYDMVLIHRFVDGNVCEIKIPDGSTVRRASDINDNDHDPYSPGCQCTLVTFLVTDCIDVIKSRGIFQELPDGFSDELARPRRDLQRVVRGACEMRSLLPIIAVRSGNSDLFDAIKRYNMYDAVMELIVQEYKYELVEQMKLPFDKLSLVGSDNEYDRTAYEFVLSKGICINNYEEHFQCLANNYSKRSNNQQEEDNLDMLKLCSQNGYPVHDLQISNYRINLNVLKWVKANGKLISVAAHAMDELKEKRSTTWKWLELDCD
jgi:hypothetical protein